MKRNNKKETSMTSIIEVIIKAIFGSEEDFDDEVEAVEENEEVNESPKPVQKQVSEPAPVQEVVPAPVQKPASEPAPVQVQAQAPAQEVSPAQKSEEAAEAVIWKTLRADLNRFVQEGETSESLLRLLEEGFEKNSQLLLQLTELVESRKMEEEVHPGYLMVYQGKQSMFSSKERAFESFFERPGSTIKETIFVSQKRNGKAVSTREATEEEKRRYYEKQSSKVDASGQEGQNN
jgi:hypothetical protein